MPRFFNPIGTIALLAAITNHAGPVQQNGAEPYQTRLFRWFDGNGEAEGVLIERAERTDQGGLQKSLETGQPGEYFTTGVIVSPELAPGFDIASAVPSWTAETPSGTWIEIFLRVKLGERWTKWYGLGNWSSSADPFTRHSLENEKDEDVEILTDTLNVRGAVAASCAQMKIRLRSFDSSATPVLTSASVVLSNGQKKVYSPSVGDPRYWGKSLDVPQFSQMVYPDGGNVWCSPTSTSMLLAYWNRYTGNPEPYVREAVAGVYDPVYKGTGNWPFNMAYAATRGMKSAVTRLTGLDVAEKYIAAGIPLGMSISWKPGELTGAPVEKSDGHLVVLCGFDENGDPVVNDPAAKEDRLVRRVYRREEFERVWRLTSGGLVYLVTPPEVEWPE